MEFYEELLLSLISILLAFLIGKVASAGSTDAADLESHIAEKAEIVERFGEGGDLGEEVRVDSGIHGESVDGGCGTEKVLGYDPIAFSEVAVEEEISIVDKKLVEGGLERSEEARAYDFDLEEENREEKRSEVNDVVEEESAKELAERLDRGKIDDELVMEEERLSTLEVEKTVESWEVRPVNEEGYETQIKRLEESGIDEKGGSLLYGEEEWEGIERSELEMLFSVATEYVGSENGGNALSKLSSDVQMQLYGLQKVATEGPCYEPQPLPLKVSARAKWHAWQKLGNMNPEVAMEQYTTLLSERIPGWMVKRPGGYAEHSESNYTPDARESRKGATDFSSLLQGQPSSGSERIIEDPSCIEVDRASSGQKVLEQGLTKTFLFNLLSPTRVTFSIFYW